MPEAYLFIGVSFVDLVSKWPSICFRAHAVARDFPILRGTKNQGRLYIEGILIELCAEAASGSRWYVDALFLAEVIDERWNVLGQAHQEPLKRDANRHCLFM